MVSFSCPKSAWARGNALYSVAFSAGPSPCAPNCDRPICRWRGVMDTISTWLCPTEQHRVRAREAGARVRTARTVAAAACGIALVAIVPFEGWWTFILFGAVALSLATLDVRLRRSERPELVAAQSIMLILAMLGLGVGLSGGEESPALPWLVLPVATAAARFRPQVVAVGAGLTAAVMCGVCFG